MAKKDILKEADSALYDISKRISFLAMNPLNESAERKRFFLSRSHEPMFRYAPYRTDIPKMIQKLESIRTDDSYMGRILDQKRRKHIMRFRMLESRGDESFTQHSLKLFGRPSRVIVMKAKRMLSYEAEKRAEKLTSAEVIGVLREALDVYGFDWGVKQKLMTSDAAVHQSKKTLLVKKGKKFSPDFIKRLIAHEIGTHVLRYENGLLQPYKIFATGFPGYLETEEGLAVINEEKAGVLGMSTLKAYAGRAIAVDMVLESSFRTVYDFLKDYFPKEQAWKLTVRAKRGISDTSKPGGLTKDHNYLTGYFSVKAYLREHSPKNLYYGKVSIGHAKVLAKIPGLAEPKYLPKDS